MLTVFLSGTSTIEVLCRKRPRGLSGHKYSNCHFPRQKIGENLVQQWASRLVAANVLAVFLSGTSTTEVLWRQGPRGLRHAKCSVVTSTDKKSVKHLSSSGFRGLCGKCVLTDFLSRKSTTAVLSPKRLRGLGGSKVLTVTSLGKKSVCALSCSGSRGLLRQMCSPFFCRGNRRRRRSVSI